MGRAGGAGAGTSTAVRSRHRTARIAMAAERKVWLPIRYHMWWVRRLLRGARGPERRLTGGRARRRGYRVAARARCCLSPASRFRPDSRDRVPFVYLYRPSPCWLLLLPLVAGRPARSGRSPPGSGPRTAGGPRLGPRFVGWRRGRGLVGRGSRGGRLSVSPRLGVSRVRRT